MTEHLENDPAAEVLGVADAKRRFSELIDRVAGGERFIVARHAKPAVALVAPSEQSLRPAPQRPVGLAAVAGTLADWDDIDAVVDAIYAARRRSRDRPVPALD